LRDVASAQGIRPRSDHRHGFGIGLGSRRS
jgi:hypothetical protein